MKLVTISGPTGSGKTALLQLAFKDAGPDARMFTRSEMEGALPYLNSSHVGLPLQSFVDGVTPELLAKLKKLGKQYDDEYVMTVAVTK